MLVMDGLLGHAQPSSDVPPRPALRTGVVDLQRLQDLDEPAQRHHRGESDLGVRVGGVLNQPLPLLQLHTHIVKLA